MKPIFFANPLEFRNWLQANHLTETELLVGYYKVNTKKPSMTWSQSVDEALCFGWIDGIRKSIDDESYCIRFTPRKPTSIWSNINIKKIEELTKNGLMQPAGILAFKNRKDDSSRIYSFESDTINLNSELEKLFKANKKAWDFFHAQAPSYKKQAIHWIMTAKQEKTKYSRLEKVMTECLNQKRLWDNYKK